MHKRIKKMLCAGCSLFLLASAMPVSAEDDSTENTITEGKLTYAEIDGGLQVVSAAEDADALKIPEKVNGQPVISIGQGAFNQCAVLKSITLPDTLTEIQDGAFYYCLALESLDIPDSVTQIGAYAFANCFALKNVELPKDLKVLPAYAFSYDIGLEEVSLPDGMEQVSSMSFVSCFSLRTVHIPASVKEIADLAFVSCMGLNDIDVNEKNLNYITDDAGAMLTSNGKTLVLYPAGREETAYSLPAGVTEIAKYAFSGAIKLEEVTMPDTVSAIGYGAFSDCRNLKSFAFPNKIKAIPASGFANCESLSAFEIPNTVTEIEEYAFYGCKGLQEISIPESVTKIGDYAFCGCTGIPRIAVPDSVAVIGACAFGFQPADNSESTAEPPVLQTGFTLAGSSNSQAKTYAAQNGISFDQIGVDPTVIAIIAVSGVVVILALVLISVFNRRKKEQPAADSAAEAQTEIPSDPNYNSILADDDEDADPYDRSYGFDTESPEQTDDAE